MDAQTPYQRLATAVLIQAWRDATAQGFVCEEVRRFLASPSEMLTHWCDQAGIEADAVAARASAAFPEDSQ